MRKRMLGVMVLALFVTVFSAIGVLAYIQHRITERRFHEQQSAILRFAVTNVEMGLSTGRIASVRKFLAGLLEYPIFSGAIVYDVDMDPLLIVPPDFTLLGNEDVILKAKRLTEGEISYEIADLKDSDNEEIGKFLIAFTFEPVKSEARRAFLYTSAFSIFILLPVMGIIALRLRWYEKALHQNEMRLLEKNRSLEATQLQLREAKQEIEHMFNNLDQGIFTINPDCSINPQHSLKARTLFGLEDFQDAQLEEVFHSNEEQARVFRKWVDFVQEPRFLRKWKMYEKLNPFREIVKRSNGSEQILKVEYTPIIENEALGKIMVLATDITEKIRSERALEKSRCEQEALMERVVALISNGKSDLDLFFSEIEGCVHGFYEIKSEKALRTNVDQLYREMHTIKGNAGTFGFNRLAHSASNLEDLFSKLTNKNNSELYRKWSDELAAFRLEFENIITLRKKMFSEGQKDRMTINQTAYNQLMQSIESGELSDITQVYEALYQLNSQPFDSFCNKYQKTIEVYREKYKKDIADLNIQNPKQIVHRDVMSAYDPCVIHIIRNALDHGIESNETRQKANKGPGMVTISFESGKNESILRVSDDGGGIDPQTVAQASAERNLISKQDVANLSHEQKINLIFEHGLSTKKESTEISGRGVGMDAIKTSIKKLNGSVSIETARGQGTTVVLRMPSARISSKN